MDGAAGTDCPAIGYRAARHDNRAVVAAYRSALARIGLVVAMLDHRTRLDSKNSTLFHVDCGVFIVRAGRKIHILDRGPASDRHASNIRHRITDLYRIKIEKILSPERIFAIDRYVRKDERAAGMDVADIGATDIPDGLDVSISVGHTSDEHFLVDFSVGSH